MWKAGRGSHTWRCSTACRNILVDQKLRQMQHCITLDMPHLFAQVFFLSSLLVFTCFICKVFRVRLSSYGYGYQSGILISFRALDTTEQGKSDSRWMLGRSDALRLLLPAVGSLGTNSRRWLRCQLNGRLKTSSSCSDFSVLSVWESD